jgi:hypothetical protein
MGAVIDGFDHLLGGNFDVPPTKHAKPPWKAAGVTSR